jgi:hypothetical protein
VEPRIKALLDTGRVANWQTHPESNRSLIKVMELVQKRPGALVECLAYVLDNGGRHEAVTTLLTAVENESRLADLVKEIRAPERFVKWLSFSPFRRIVQDLFKEDARLVKLAGEVIDTASNKLELETIKELCELTGRNGAELLAPGRMSTSCIYGTLIWLAIKEKDFFPNIAQRVVEDCVRYRPYNDAKLWLEVFLRGIIKYYGETSVDWLTSVAELNSEPFVWEAALSFLFQRPLPNSLAPERRACARRLQSEQLRREIRNELKDHVYRLAKSEHVRVVVEAPLILRQPTSEFPGHGYRPIWSWLLSEAAEAALYSWLQTSCLSVLEDYGSPEDSITGGLCAYLKSHAIQYQGLIQEAWRASHPYEGLELTVDWVECRKGRDVGGADLVIVLSADGKSTYSRASFAAFQAKKLRGASLPLGDREVAQLNQLRAFTHASYYLLYPCEYATADASVPIVLPARTVDGLIRGRSAKSVSREMLTTISKGLSEYFVADLLPGWSGDERWEKPETIREVVDAALHPVHMLNVTVRVVPRENSDSEGGFPYDEG